MIELKEQLLEYVSNVAVTRKKYFLDLFRYIPETTVKEMVYTTVKKGDYIVCAEEPSETIYFLLSGNVVGFDYQKMGHVYSFMDFTQMYIIGDFEIFGNYPGYCITVRAMEECKLLKISSKSYLRWIQHDENALFLRLQNIMTTLTFERQIDREFLHMTCKERLVSYLIKYYDKKVPNGMVKDKLIVRKSQTELAEKVGYHIRSVQRSIASLEKEGTLSNVNGKIAITYEQYLKLIQNVEKEGRR